MLILAVLHLKGGSGKSTLAIHVASAAHLEGLRVMVLDLDSQSTILHWSGARSVGSELAGVSVAKIDKVAAIDRDRLAPLIRGYDLVVLDAPARDVKITEAAATAADVVLLPMQPGPTDMWPIEDTTAAIDAADTTRELRRLPPVKRCHVINRAVSGSRLEGFAKAQLLSTVGDYAGVVHQRLVFPEAIALGECVQTVRPAAPEAAHEIRQLWKTIKGKAA